MPVSDSRQLSRLRADGLPAILVSGSSVDAAGTQRIAVQFNGAPLLSLQWSAGNSADTEASNDTKRLILGRLPLFSVVPYLQGSSRMRIRRVSLPVLPEGAVPQGEYGSLQLAADPAFGKLDAVLNSYLQADAGSFAALLPASASGAGQFRHLQQSLLLQVQALP